ncbi:MAG: hypothetical protein K2M14_07525, partial [Muribaculaceae bacterium]|nr:hypothetical protein [Muribaculaceae bacterium]
MIKTSGLRLTKTKLGLAKDGVPLCLLTLPHKQNLMLMKKVIFLKIALVLSAAAMLLASCSS